MLSKRLRAVNGQMGNTHCVNCVLYCLMAVGQTRYIPYTQMKHKRMKLRDDNGGDSSNSSSSSSEKMQNTEQCGHRQSTVVFAISTRTVVCHCAPLKIKLSSTIYQRSIKLHKKYTICSINFSFVRYTGSMLLNTKARKLEMGKKS